MKIEIYRFTDSPRVARDRRFCDDIRAAAASVCANISEGFGRHTHAEFAQFLTIARGSLAETQNHLSDAFDRGYLMEEKFKELWCLSTDVTRSVSALLTYLRTHRTPVFHKAVSDR